MRKSAFEIFITLWKAGAKIMPEDAKALHFIGKELYRLAELRYGVVEGDKTIFLCCDKGKYYIKFCGAGLCREFPLKRNPYAYCEKLLNKVAKKYSGITFKTYSNPRRYVLKAVVNDDEVGIF